MCFVPSCQAISLRTVDLSTSCVPLWRPLLPIKGGPRRPGEGFGSFGQVTPRSWLKNTRTLNTSTKLGLGYYASSRPKPGYTNCVLIPKPAILTTPHPVNRSRDSCDPIGVVPTDRLQ